MFRSKVSSKKIEINEPDGEFGMAELYGDDSIATMNLKDINGVKGIDKLRNYETKRPSLTDRRTSLATGRASLRNSPRQLIDEYAPNSDRESLSMSNPRYSLSMKLFSSPNRTSIIPVAQAEAVLVNTREEKNDSSSPVHDPSPKLIDRGVVRAEPISDDDYNSNADSGPGILLQGAGMFHSRAWVGSRQESSRLSRSNISNTRHNNTLTSSIAAASDTDYRTDSSDSVTDTASTASATSSNASSPPNSLNQIVLETISKRSTAESSTLRPGFQPGKYEDNLL